MSKPYVLPATWTVPSAHEVQIVSELLGKSPQGEFQIVIRSETGVPRVIENMPFFFDGTPMPTRYWLVDPQLIIDVSKIESTGGVKQVQEEIPMDDIMAIHHRYEAARDTLVAPGYEGPRPSGGVGGTRRGVKCLHTHVANYLVTTDDVIGFWTMSKIEEMKQL